MPDFDGGGGYAGTNWSAKPMAAIWQAMHNQQTDNHWTLLGGWRRSADLILQHISAVQNYRENLATAWPPEKSQAAAAYLGRLDNLLTQLRQTYDAAAANYDVFHAATQALTAARRDLEPLVTEHQANATKLAAFEQAQSRPPAPIRGAQLPTSPVAANRQAELEARARAIMYSLSSELIAARGQLVQPPAYEPSQMRFEGSETDAITYTAPTRPRSLSSGSAAGADWVSSNRPPDDSVVGNGSAAGSTGTGKGPGLVLGGSEPPIAVTTPGQNVSPPLHTGGQPPLSSPAPIGSAPIIPVSPIGRIPSSGGGPGGVATAPTAGSRHAMPPGGVIGMGPGAGLGPPVPNTRPGPVANPVGGLIGPPASSGAGSAGGRSSAPPVGFTPGGGRVGRADSSSTQRWDPDNPWQTSVGVDPVISPPPEQPIDPGPAIGLR